MLKKIFVILGLFMCTAVASYAADNYINLEELDIQSNTQMTQAQYKRAQKIIRDLQNETPKQFNHNYGPFLAAIYDDKGNLIAKAQNSVIPSCDCTNHAEMNAIRLAQKKLNTYDLSKYNLSIYVTAEPCIMCAGAIMWSGLKNVYFSVYSKDVENITGFDEGYKPNWISQFKKRGINVYGGIEQELGKQILSEYVNEGNTIYKPARKCN